MILFFLHQKCFLKVHTGYVSFIVKPKLSSTFPKTSNFTLLIIRQYFQSRELLTSLIAGISSNLLTYNRKVTLFLFLNAINSHCMY